VETILALALLWLLLGPVVRLALDLARFAAPLLLAIAAIALARMLL
jgi:hypothetical protein